MNIRCNAYILHRFTWGEVVLRTGAHNSWILHSIYEKSYFLFSSPYGELNGWIREKVVTPICRLPWSVQSFKWSLRPSSTWPCLLPTAYQLVFESRQKHLLNLLVSLYIWGKPLCWLKAPDVSQLDVAHFTLFISIFTIFIIH